MPTSFLLCKKNIFEGMEGDARYECRISSGSNRNVGSGK